MDLFCLFIFCVFIAALLSPAGKDWPLGSVECEVLLCFCQFPMWCPGSVVVLDCIDSRSLHSHLLSCIMGVCVRTIFSLLVVWPEYKCMSKRMPRYHTIYTKREYIGLYQDIP